MIHMCVCVCTGALALQATVGAGQLEGGPHTPTACSKTRNPRNQGRPEVCPHRTRGVEGVLAWVGPCRFRSADRCVLRRSKRE